MTNVEQLEKKVQHLRSKRSAAEHAMTKTVWFFVVLIVALVLFLLMNLMIGMDEATSELFGYATLVSFLGGIVYFLIAMERHMICSGKIDEAELQLKMAKQRG